MKRIPVREVPAGPALDAAVAEHVMGWHRSDSGKTWRDARGEYACRFRNGYGFAPSSYIATAMQVVERMGELGYSYILESCEGEHTAHFARPHEEGSFETGATIALNICRAALIACGVTEIEVEDDHA